MRYFSLQLKISAFRFILTALHKKVLKQSNTIGLFGFVCKFFVYGDVIQYNLSGLTAVGSLLYNFFLTDCRGKSEYTKEVQKFSTIEPFLNLSLYIFRVLH